MKLLYVTVYTGLVAVRSDDVLEVMSEDFPEKYVHTHTIGYVQLYNTNKYELYLLLHT